MCWMSCECLLQASGGLGRAQGYKEGETRDQAVLVEGWCSGPVPLPQPGFPPVSLPAQTGRHMITWPDTGHLISQDIYLFTYYVVC